MTDRGRPPRLGYVLKKYPRLSETFIVNEVLALEAAGAEVEIFSLLRPDDGVFHGELARVRARARYLQEPHGIRGVLDGLGARAARFGGDGREGRRAHWDAAFWEAIEGRYPSPVETLFQAAEVAERAERAGVEHLHAHFATAAARTAALASILLGVPWSFTAHAKDIFSTDVDWALLARLLASARFAVTVSDENCRTIRQRVGGELASKVHRIYNGVDRAVFLSDGGEAAATGVGPPLILGVGRLIPKKGFPVLIDACAILDERRVPFRCEIVGDGVEAPALAARIRDRRLDGKVRLAGALPHEAVRERLARATALALPCVVDENGDRDALPTVLIEALAAGVPAVSTDLSGVLEILDGGRAGLVVGQGDAVGLARALARVLGDPDLRREIASRGRSRAEQEFDLARNVGQLLDLFRGLGL